MPTKGTILSLVVELLKAKFKVDFAVVTEEDPSFGGTSSDDTRRSDFSRQSQDLTGGTCQDPQLFSNQTQCHQVYALT